MKKLIVLGASIIFLTVTANAQVKRETSPSQATQSDAKGKFKKKEVLKELNLSKEQRSQIKELRQSMKQEKETIENDKNLSEDQKQIKLKESHRSQQLKMNSILTPEQKEIIRKKKMDFKNNKADTMMNSEIPNQ